MLKEDIQVELFREPFVPLRLHLSDGKRFDVPFRGVARVLSYGILVFIDKDPKTQISKATVASPSTKSEQRPGKGDSRRKKAS